MADGGFDGLGQYDLPTPEYPAIDGTTIYAETFNTIVASIGDALSLVLVRDGQASMTGNLNLGTFALQNGTIASTVLVATQTAGTNNTTIASTAFVVASFATIVTTDDLQDQIDLKAPLASPGLTGIPTAPTAAVGTNTTQIATMAAVLAQAYTTGFPSMAGHSGEYLTNDGVTTPSWAALPKAVGATIFLANNFGAL